MVEREVLRRWLGEHLAADEREASYLAAMKDLVDGPEDPAARTSFRPGHFTASAFVLSPDLSSLLLILHSKLGLWLQPGGHMDLQDSCPREAAMRELAEEAGVLDVESLPGFGCLLDVDVHSIPPNPGKSEPAHEHHDLRLALRSSSWDLRPASDALDARWVPLKEVQHCGTDESVLRAQRKLLSVIEQGRIR